MIETAIPNIDGRLEEARSKQAALWEKFQAIEKEMEPHMKRIAAARSEWYEQTKLVDVLEVIKNGVAL